MRFVFLHHEMHGPVSTEQLWDGTSGFGGSVARLRILFWLAAKGHEVVLIGNVQAGETRGVRAISGLQTLSELAKHGVDGRKSVLVLNNPPDDKDWLAIRATVECPIILWAGNPIELRWVTRAQKGEVAKVVCVSEYHRELYRIYSGFESFEATYSGVDLDLFAKAEPVPEAEGAVVFCSIPRRTKGIHNLAAAWRLVLKAIPDTRLRVCGSAAMHDPNASLGWTGVFDRDVEEEFPDLLGSPSALKRSGITLLGGPKDISVVYGEMKKAALVVVNCNWKGSAETYCRAAVEAQIAGTPVVGAARGSLPEVVSHTNTGLLVNGADPEELGGAIISILRDSPLNRRMRAGGPAWALPLADYTVLTKDWEDIAARACTGQPSPNRGRWKGDLLRRMGYGAIRAGLKGIIAGMAKTR